MNFIRFELQRKLTKERSLSDGDESPIRDVCNASWGLKFKLQSTIAAAGRIQVAFRGKQGRKVLIKLRSQTIINSIGIMIICTTHSHALFAFLIRWY
jgi:hypothetical protein